MAGVLRMPWRKFLLFNFLGAAVWVTVISLVGYFFGSEWDRLLHYMKRFNLIFCRCVRVDCGRALVAQKACVKQTLEQILEGLVQ